MASSASNGLEIASQVHLLPLEGSVSAVSRVKNTCHLFGGPALSNAEMFSIWPSQNVCYATNANALFPLFYGEC